MEIRVVVDIDDTICTNTRKLSYDKCSPVRSVINGINYLHDELGIQIVLYTSRGMVSCGGDIGKILEKNKAILERWLSRNNVHYDEIVFGKPIADLYIDDKALNVSDFRRAEFYKLNGGGSGKELYRLGRIVKKDLGDSSERFKDWIEDNGGACRFPKVVSYFYNEVSMEFVDGDNLCNSFEKSDFYSLLSIVEAFSEKRFAGFDMEKHIEILEKNRGFDGDLDEIIDTCESNLFRLKDNFKKYASYSHSDLILSNVIKNPAGLYLIDPQYIREASSFILDYGKIRMSLMNYEKRFGISKADNSHFLSEFDMIMKGRGVYREVLLANLMYICRLARYKKDKRAVTEMARELLMEAGDVF